MPTGKTKGKKPKKKSPELKEFTHSRQLLLIKKLSEVIRKSKGKKKITMGKLMREVGFSASFSEHPKKLFKSKNFKELLNHYLPDHKIAEVHAGVLEASKLDHMVFPLAMDDKKIKNVIESVSGCKVRRIEHGEQANHAYFWAPDNHARLKAIAEAYKIKNKYDPEEIVLTNKLTDELLNRIIKD